MNARKPPRTRARQTDAGIPAHALVAPDATAPSGSAPEASAARTHDGEHAALASVPSGRGALSDLTERGLLTHAQEAACERLISSQEDEIRIELPPLLLELKPHFDTPGEAAAKEAFTDALRTIKDRQQADFVRLLESFGLDASALAQPA